MPIYVTGKSQADLPEGYHSLTDQLVRTQPVPICKVMRETVPALHPCCFIYTSGTTGKCVQNYTAINKEIKNKSKTVFFLIITSLSQLNIILEKCNNNDDFNSLI